MGNSSSSEVNLRKQSGQKSPRKSLGSRNSSARVSKRDVMVNEISHALQVLQREIDVYNGVRGTPEYKDMHARLSARIQQVQYELIKIKNPEKQEPYKKLKSESIQLFKLLEDRVEFNEMQLDAAAIESHSFIDQTPKMKNKEVNKKIITDTGAGNLEEVEARIKVLGDEIDNALTLEDTSKYKILEQKLNMLYGDLAEIDPKTKKSSEKKDSIGKLLMRQGRKLQSFKDKKPRVSILKPDIKEQIQKERQTISKIEDDLSDIEVRVMTFEDLKSDAKYRELDQTLKEFWGTLSNLTDSSEENRKRKLKTIDLIKKMLQELNRRSDENSIKINNALDKINDIEDDVLSIKSAAENFSGTRNDNNYNQIDQKLRSLWAKLNDIHNNYEAVELRKQEIIDVIQKLLRKLLEISEANEISTTYANIDFVTGSRGKEDFKMDPKKAPVASPRGANERLIKQLRELEYQWNSLEGKIREDINHQDAKQIFNILKSMHSSIENKCELLNDLIKRISSDNKKTSIENKKNSIENKKNSIENKKISIENNRYPEPIQKITVSEKNINEKLSIQDSLANYRPEEQLISELAIDRTLVTLNTIEQDLSILRSKMLNSQENLETTKGALDKLQKNFLDIEGNANPTVNDRRSQVYTIMRSCYDLYDQTKSLSGKDDTSKLKTIVEAMQKLKKKVDCFSGTFKSVQYNQIEEGLRQCIDDLSVIEPQNDKIATTKFQLQRKLERYLEILDERSLKVGSQEDLVQTPSLSFTDKATKIVDTLTNIRAALAVFEENPDVPALQKNIKTAEDLIKDLHPESTEHKKIQEQYQDYLKQLVVYFNSKVEDPDDSPTKTLMQYEKELTDLKNEVHTMKAIEHDTDFEKTQLELDDLLVRIDSVEVLNQPDKEFKSNLQGDIQSLSSLLKTKRRSSKRMSQYNNQMHKAKLEEIQEDIGRLADEVHNFSGENYRQRYDQLDEHMTQLFLKIQSYDLDGSMRDYLIRQIQSNKKQLDLKLAEITYNFEKDTRGTEV